MRVGIIVAQSSSFEFKSKIPICLHKIDGKSIVGRIVDSFKMANIDKIYLVANEENYFILKKECLGVNCLFYNNITGKGAFSCFDNLFNIADEVIVVNSDSLIIDKYIIKDFIDKCILNCFELGHFTNGDVYYFRGVLLDKYKDFLINNSEKNSFEALLKKEKSFIYKEDDRIVCVKDKKDFVSGVKLFYLFNCNKLLEEGVKIYDINDTYIGDDVVIGKDVEIYPNNYILGDSRIGDNSVILPNNYIIDSIIEKRCTIGPFSNLKKGTKIGDDCVIGAFVELKNSEIKSGVKAKHHIYLGDVFVGENTNVGCGVIVCNYDGKKKHKSYIGKNSFIGSNTTLVSPLNIGDNVVVGAGSTIVEDVKDNSLAIARNRQVNKDGYYVKKQAFKAKKND